MKTLIVITGPTASGKTGLALKLAEQFKTEILSSDSRQFYRGLDIGTAKPNRDELNKIKHHFIDSLSPEEDYNVDQFERDALKCLESIFIRHDVAVLAGGSGLYIQTVCYGIDELPGTDPVLRASLQEIHHTQGISGLQKILQELDPDYYASVDQLNPHRLIRAIEVCRLTGLKFSQLRTQKKKERPFRIIKIGLLVDRTELNERINRRVDEMIRQGLIDEARRLYPLRNFNSLQTVGYQELFEYLENKTGPEEAIEKIKQHTRQYAKRQMTFFRKDPDIHWFLPEDEPLIIPYIETELKSAGKDE